MKTLTNRNPSTQSRLEGQKFAIYAEQRRHMESLWELVSKPIKFPNRRRREDREIPKAA